MPPNVAIIAEAETDNKNRTMSELKLVVKKAGAVTSATGFYFSKRGRVVFAPKEGGPTVNDLLDEAMEHEGVEDVEELPDGGFLAWTEPPMLMALTEAFAKKFGLEVLESDIVWDPNGDTQVDIDNPDTAEGLGALFSAMKEFQEVKAIYANIRQGKIPDEDWDRIDRHLDV